MKKNTDRERKGDYEHTGIADTGGVKTPDRESGGLTSACAAGEREGEYSGFQRNNHRILSGGTAAAADGYFPFSLWGCDGWSTLSESR